MPSSARTPRYSALTWLLVLVVGLWAGPLLAQTASTPQTTPPTAPASAPSSTDTSTNSTTNNATAAKPVDPDASIYGVPTADKETAKKLKAEDNVYLIGNRDVGKGLDFYSQSSEVALGQQLAAEIMKDSVVITDPVVNEYINRLAQNMVRNSDAKVPFTVHVLQDDSINAFSLPGGFFFVNSGIILACTEEDELAGVMGHEIAHVAARHATRTATKAELMEMLTIPAEIIGGPGIAGLGVGEAANAAIPVEYEHFSRGDEEEADWLGVQYLWKAGYDPQGLARAFEIIEQDETEKPGIIARLYSSHPQTPERVALTEKEIATIIPPRPEYIVTTSEFQVVQARLRALLKSKVEPGVTVPDGGARAATQAPPNPPGPPVIQP